MMKRTALRRFRREITAPTPPPRPGAVPALPADWPARCKAVRRRDRNRCRFCGHPVPTGGGAIDHVLPRRITGDGWRDSLNNLALLCEGPCHARKTHLAEAALFRGDPYIFFRHLEVLKLGGPVPTADQIGEAFGRLRALLQKE